VDHFCLYDEKDRECGGWMFNPVFVFTMRKIESVEGGCSILFDQMRLEKGCVFL
jgi:hypothetical protein